MARFSVRVVMLFILGCGTINSSDTAALSLEDKLKELESSLEMKFISLEAKNAQLEEKVTQLETQLEQNNEQREVLTLKVTQLEATNVRLEAKVQEQENILTSLLQATELPTSTAGGSKSIAANNRQNVIQSSGKSGFPGTCRELRTTNPSLPSGMQWIDPDGQGVGEDPIYVYCNMTSGSTSILHDSEIPIDVGHCADPGCYSRPINYNASFNQIKSLVELSAECHQSIKYDCYYAPFQFDKPYAWWNDRDGNAQYFWAGNNADGDHTCQCGIDENCVDSVVKCNCDTSAPVQLVDDGVITDKNVLPVTRLNFGRTQLATSSGIHTLGRLVCSGSEALNRLPTSCEDLWLIGHTLNGVYFIKGTKMMESVYCDFTKLPDDAGFQKWIGFADVKSVSVHFYVQRSYPFNTTGTSIPWDLAVMNEGNAMNLTSGKFTAPRLGIYFFSFTGMGSFPASSGGVFINVALYLNGDKIGRGYVEEGNTFASQDTQVTLQSTMNLKKGDQVWLQIDGLHSGTSLFDNAGHLNHFTGFMLEEEIAASLSYF